MKRLVLPRNLVRKQGGFILIATYLIVAVISIFSLAYFTRSNIFLQANERNYNKLVAFNMAEAAVSFALTQLTADPNYAGTPAYVSLDTASVRGGFTVTVTPDPANTMVRLIQATGFAPDNVNTSRGYQAVPIVTYGQFTPGDLFDFAIFAEDTITLTDNDKIASMDSYDSRDGAYGGDNKSSNADIAVNSTAEDAISLNGTTLVEGNVSVGTGGDPDTGIDIGAKAAITGTTSALTDAMVYPAPSTTLPSAGALSVNGADQYLPAGIYHFDSLSITSTLIFTGEGTTTIFVDGGVNIAGLGIVTESDSPPDLIIYVLGSETVKVAGNGSFYGGIYAPNSLVQNTGNGGIFGSVIAKDYDQNSNSSIHFDEAMTEVESDQTYGTIGVTAWQEINSLTWGVGT